MCFNRQEKNIQNETKTKKQVNEMYNTKDERIFIKRQSLSKILLNKKMFPTFRSAELMT
jgi:beta-galactosidase beta subunit